MKGCKPQKASLMADNVFNHINSLIKKSQKLGSSTAIRKISNLDDEEQSPSTKKNLITGVTISLKVFRGILDEAL
jgi:hypothetical protein